MRVNAYLAYGAGGIRTHTGVAPAEFELDPAARQGLREPPPRPILRVDRPLRQSAAAVAGGNNWRPCCQNRRQRPLATRRLRHPNRLWGIAAAGEPVQLRRPLGVRYDLDGIVRIGEIQIVGIEVNASDGVQTIEVLDLTFVVGN